jgi:hypothetical protein
VLLHASFLSLAAVLYLGLIATVLAYASWGGLLARYPAALRAAGCQLVRSEKVTGTTRIDNNGFSGPDFYSSQGP